MTLIDRRTVRLTLAFAALHFLLSAALYLAALRTVLYVAAAGFTVTMPRWVVASEEVLTLMHWPALFLVDGPNPSAVASPEVLAVVAFDSLVWGFAAACAVRWLRWVFAAPRPTGDAGP